MQVLSFLFLVLGLKLIITGKGTFRVNRDKYREISGIYPRIYGLGIVVFSIFMFYFSIK